MKNQFLLSVLLSVAMFGSMWAMNGDESVDASKPNKATDTRVDQLSTDDMQHVVTGEVVHQAHPPLVTDASTSTEDENGNITPTQRAARDNVSLSGLFKEKVKNAVKSAGESLAKTKSNISANISKAGEAIGIKADQAQEDARSAAKAVKGAASEAVTSAGKTLGLNGADRESYQKSAQISQLISRFEDAGVININGASDYSPEQLKQKIEAQLDSSNNARYEDLTSENKQALVNALVDKYTNPLYKPVDSLPDTLKNSLTTADAKASDLAERAGKQAATTASSIKTGAKGLIDSANRALGSDMNAQRNYQAGLKINELGLHVEPLSKGVTPDNMRANVRQQLDSQPKFQDLSDNAKNAIVDRYVSDFQKDITPESAKPTPTPDKPSTLDNLKQKFTQFKGAARDLMTRLSDNLNPSSFNAKIRQGDPNPLAFLTENPEYAAEIKGMEPSAKEKLLNGFGKDISSTATRLYDLQSENNLTKNEKNELAALKKFLGIDPNNNNKISAQSLQELARTRSLQVFDNDKFLNTEDGQTLAYNKNTNRIEIQNVKKYNIVTKKAALEDNNQAPAPDRAARDAANKLKNATPVTDDTQAAHQARNQTIIDSVQLPEKGKNQKEVQKDITTQLSKNANYKALEPNQKKQIVSRLMAMYRAQS